MEQIWNSRPLAVDQRRSVGANAPSQTRTHDNKLAERIRLTPRDFGTACISIRSHCLSTISDRIVRYTGRARLSANRIIVQLQLANGWDDEDSVLTFTFGWLFTMQFSQTFTRCSKQNWFVTCFFGHLQRPIARWLIGWRTKRIENEIEMQMAWLESTTHTKNKSSLFTLRRNVNRQTSEWAERKRHHFSFLAFVFWRVQCISNGNTRWSFFYKWSFIVWRYGRLQCCVLIHI